MLWLLVPPRGRGGGVPGARKKRSRDDKRLLIEVINSGLLLHARARARDLFLRRGTIARFNLDAICKSRETARNLPSFVRAAARVAG